MSKPSRFWSAWGLRLASVLLYPATTLACDLLGHLWLNPYCPRGDFGLWASSVTVPGCYFAGLALLTRSFHDSFPHWIEQLLIGLILAPFYFIPFAIWTFLTFPFGRLDDTF